MTVVAFDPNKEPNQTFNSGNYGKPDDLFYVLLAFSSYDISMAAAHAVIRFLEVYPEDRRALI
jgi:hypothetical protein